jgi:two-component SAPR family response regulator
MDPYRICLFREFEAQCRNQPVANLGSKKALELFCFLMINRERPHTREQLAGLLWENNSATQSKQYLRQVLWQLQSALDQSDYSPGCLLSIESDWISFNLNENVWLDVAEFERAYQETQNLAGRDLNKVQADSLEGAVDLYRGDLLETWYYDWCIFERERLQNLYLAMLDKLSGFYEASLNYQAGLDCAMKLLRKDIAHERTYRRLMRILYFTGNRTGALRQFQRCEEVLEKELGIGPSQRTLLLKQQIKSDQFPIHFPATGDLSDPDRAAVKTMLNRLAWLNEHFAQSQSRLAEEIDAIRAAMADLIN